MSTPAGWIEVLDWDRHQHPDTARSTVPPWIKIHTRLLSDDAFLELTAHQRAVLFGLWLEYARSRRQLRANTASLSARLSLRVSSQQLKALSDAGFIRIVASNPASNPACLDRDREREGSSRTENPARTSSSPTPSRLPYSSPPSPSSRPAAGAYQPATSPPATEPDQRIAHELRNGTGPVNFAELLQRLEPHEPDEPEQLYAEPEPPPNGGTY